MLGMSPRRPPLLVVAVAAAAVALTAVPGVATASEPTVRPTSLQVMEFLGEQRLPTGMMFQNTSVGGFSGLDRDHRTGRWVIVSDDRSAKQAARFYDADLRFDGTGGALSAVTLTGTHPFLRPGGTTYPPLSAGDGTTVDPEDIRVDPITDRILWSQEGERIVPADGTAPTLIDPTVRFARPDGTYVSQLTVPAEERVTSGPSGIQQNLGPEGLTFAARGGLVVTAVEAPLLQDGPSATPAAGARSRIVVQNRRGRVLAEYAYPQEPVFASPVPAGAAASNGVSALLAVDDADPTRFLVMERAFVTGVGNKVRIYEVDTVGATNLGRGTPIAAATPVRKHLLLDVADLPVKSVDNIEGMAWGPDRGDGSRPLVLVSDDNFSASQVTQFVAVTVR